MSKKNIVRERLNYIALIIIVIGIVISILLLFKFHKWYFFIPTLYYYSSLRIDEGIRHTSEILGSISLLITFIILIKLFCIKTVKKQFVYAVLGLGISILSYISFFILAPGYTFEKYPQYFMYMDDNKEYIENVERYIYLVDSFGFYQSTYRPFKTLDDAIKGLEFAKERNERVLYIKIVKDIVEIFGLKQIYEKYNDITFQSFIVTEATYLYANDHFGKSIMKELLTDNNFYLISTQDAQIKNIINIIYSHKDSILSEDLEVISSYVSNNLREQLEMIVRNIPGVNLKITHNPK